ncbi:C40 family peptidase [Rhodococcus pyridinivorans]|uniref:C40 family peptidase n=1 Tax=Rhodococcus pyridinivorans TaxID=103816 RepID=UPI00265955BA|nr:C40 family peptidase [Rhodococcus pyridinivorans]
MTEIEVDAGAVSDAVARAKTELEGALEAVGLPSTVGDARVADALNRLRDATQDGGDASRMHLDSGAGAARAIEASDGEGATAAGGVGAASMPASPAARIQPNIQIPPAALAQIAGASPPPVTPPVLSPMAPSMASPATALNMIAPVAAQVAQAAQAAAAPGVPAGVGGLVAMTPEQQQRLAEALSGGVGSSGGSVGLGSSSGDLADIARALVAADIPYAWGGGSLEGPSQGISDGGGAADAHGDYNKIGFDCSGLARYVHYQLTGEEVARTSEAQFAQGTEVSLSEAQPGDFVFPNSSFGGGGPGHVQIYLGDGKVLEAPQSGDKVKISEMTPSVIKRM